MLTLQALRVFVTAAESGGIRRAAERMHRTPSAVSMSLKQLEEELGAPLFIGDRKSMLTELGEMVLEQARDVLVHFDGAAITMRAFAKNRSGQPRLGSVTSVSAALLPLAIRRISDEVPGFQVHVRQMESYRSCQGILDGTVDLAFGSWLDGHDDVLFQPLFRDPLDVICCAGHPLNGHHGPLTLEMLKDWRFITINSFRTMRSSVLDELSAGATISAGSVANLIGMVRAGVRVSILPRRCDVGTEGVSFLPLAEPDAHRVVGMMSRRNRGLLRATQLLSRTVRTVIAERSLELKYEYLEADAPF